MSNGAQWQYGHFVNNGISSSNVFLFVFLSCVAQWKSYQEARQTVIELMNEAEKKLTEFSTAKAATSQEAEDKLCSHRVRGTKTKSFSIQQTGGAPLNVMHLICLLSLDLSVACVTGEWFPREAEWFGGASCSAWAGGEWCQQGHHQSLDDHCVAALDTPAKRSERTGESTRGYGTGMEDF